MLCHTYKMGSHLTEISVEDQAVELYWVNVLSKWEKRELYYAYHNTIKHTIFALLCTYGGR
jgi:hypothetical protein